MGRRVWHMASAQELLEITIVIPAPPATVWPLFVNVEVPQHSSGSCSFLFPPGLQCHAVVYTQRHRSPVFWLCPFPCQPSSPSCLVSSWISAIGSYCSANIHSGGTLYLPTPKSFVYLVARGSFWIRPSLLCSWLFNGRIITLRMKSKLLYMTYNILYHLVLHNSLASSGAILLLCHHVLALVIPLCPVKCFSSWDSYNINISMPDVVPEAP